MAFLIREVPLQERPREKALRLGIESLSNIELLALILRSGNKNRPVLQLAHELLSKIGGIESLRDMSAYELMQIDGIKLAKALDILASIELSKRINESLKGSQYQIKSPQDIYDYFAERYIHYQQEHFVVFLLDTKNKVINRKTLFIGTLNASIVHPREIFKEALKHSCAHIICMHNHPSGDPTPSKEDIEITKVIKEAGQLVGITLLDHIIVGSQGFYSLKENQDM